MEIHFLWHHVELFDTVLHLSGGIDKGTVCHWRGHALCAAGDSAGNCGYFWGNLPLFWLSALMILAAGGDLTILWKLFRFPRSKGEVRFLDHPYEVGLVIFERTFSKV